MIARFLERVKFWLLTIGLLIALLLPFDCLWWLRLGMLFLWLSHVKGLKTKGSADETNPESSGGTAPSVPTAPGQHGPSEPRQDQPAMESVGMDLPDLGPVRKER